ncbi:MAG: hypothetical protein ACFFCS_24990 [Candidatus Hodarchaeota archaeon]
MFIDTKKPITLLIMFLMGCATMSFLATAPLLAIGGIDNFTAAQIFIIVGSGCLGFSFILAVLGIKKIEDKKTRTDADKLFFLLFFITLGLFVTSIIMANV